MRTLLFLAALAGASAYLRRTNTNRALGDETQSTESRFAVADADADASESGGASVLRSIHETDVVIVSQNMANHDVSFTWNRQKTKLAESGIDCTSAQVIVVATQENAASPIDYVNGVFQGCPMKNAAGADLAVPAANPALEYFDKAGKPLAKAPAANAANVIIKHAASGTIWTRKLVQTTIHVWDIKQWAFGQYLAVFTKWESATVPSKYSVKEDFVIYLSKKMGRHFKNKGILTALVHYKDAVPANSRSFIVASGHLPMKGSDSATHGYGKDLRIAAWKTWSQALVSKTWYKAEMPILWTGDSNFRVDNVEGDQLESIFRENKADSPFAGWMEPSLPRGYTCRYQTANYHSHETNAAKATTDKATLEACRSGTAAEWSLDWSGAAVPYSKYPDYKDLFDGVPSLLAHGPKKDSEGVMHPITCTAATVANIDRLVSTSAAGAAKNRVMAAKLFCGCGSLDKIRPLGYCDRVIYKHGGDVKIRYNAYESVYLHDGSDHNAIAASVKILFATEGGAFEDAANVAGLQDLETALGTAQAASGSGSAKGHLNLVAVPAVAAPSFGQNTRHAAAAATKAAVEATIKEAAAIETEVAKIPDADLPEEAPEVAATMSLDDPTSPPKEGGTENDNIDLDDLLTEVER